MYESAVKGILLEHMFADRRQIGRAEPSEVGRWIAHEAMTAGPDGAARADDAARVRAAWSRLG
jgi:hypothetical protein